MNSPREQIQKQLFGSTTADNIVDVQTIEAIKEEVGQVAYCGALVELTDLIEQSQGVKSLMESCSPIAKSLLIAYICYGFPEDADSEELIG